MRVTNQSLRDQSLREIHGNLGRLADLQRQVATGKRFNRAEEDPLGATQVLRARQGQRAIDQYAKNGTNAQVRLGAEEAVVKQVDELLRTGRNAALSFAKGDPPYTATQVTQRQLATGQLDRLLEEAVSLGNTKIGSEYILAGERSTTPPFDPTAGATLGTYQGGTSRRQIEIADGVQVSVNHTGDQFVGPAIAALRALRNAVDPANAQTEAQVQVEVDNVYAASQNLSVSQVQTGTTANQVASTLTTNTGRKNDLENLRASVEDIQLEDAVAKLLSLQTTIQASYSATGRLISLSLTDYLR
jgi:flagellar hook-associated protein 3 FlgL